jgi:hypothetical protein
MDEARWTQKRFLQKPAGSLIDTMFSNSYDNMMKLGGTPKPQVAETLLLNWDGSNTTLQFFIVVRDVSSSSCPSVAPRVTACCLYELLPQV